MTGQCRVNSYFSRFFVADFTDHNDIGVLTQKRPERCGKSYTRKQIYLGLIDIFNIIFNRVLNSNDVDIGFV